MKITMLNTTILTNDGEYVLKTISVKEVKEIIAGQEIVSAIGHQSTAEILSTLLETEIPVNRIMFSQEVGQLAICFKLNGRPPEGEILTKNQLEEIGYSFKLLERVS